MIFNTWVYGVFMAGFFILYWLVPRRGRTAALLVGGLVFYTYYLPAHTLLIAALILATYGLGAVMDWLKTRRVDAPLKGFLNVKTVLALSLVLCLGVLAYFKYLKLLAATFDGLILLLRFGAPYQLPDIVIPLGLSFFIFEFVHYLAEVYKGSVPRGSLLEYASFGLFFPTLVAGPIKRFQPFLEQLRNPAGFRLEFVSDGLYRILLGLGKKMIVADSMTYFTGPLVNPLSAAGADCWVAMYAFAIKIYFDFSGYSDIAIGSAKLLGFKVPENFDRPYFQQNISVFWNKWHMSLSSWIRDYLYIPLGGNRGTFLFTLRNLIVAMALCGLWHGAAWNFVVWGLYHGLGMSLFRVYRKKGAPLIKNIERLPAPLIRVVSILITFHFVCFGWVFFATDPGTAFQFLALLF
ncbi:MAG: Peptidoglycan O-acetyltransferase [Firmicutes bacterium ADurb.Bin373]|nr:MAG: Peptidoglycan O-acetyltransferase [Firmicutes bacterium ADurb.Bin373]